VCDASLRYTTCNGAFADLMGKNKAQILGKTFEELLSPELLGSIELQEINKASKRVDLELSLGICTEQTFETKAFRKMSQTFLDMLSHRSAIIRDGKFAGTVTVLTDVTDIRAKEKRQRQVMDAVPHPVFIKDSTLAYQEINSAMENWFSIPRETLLGGTWDKILVDVDRHFPDTQKPNFIRSNIGSLKATLEFVAGKDAELFSKSFSAPQVFSYNMWHVGEGEYKDVVFRRHGMYSEDGEFMGVAGIIEDVSPLRNTERMLDSISTLFDVAAYRLNTKGSVVDCNQKLLDLIGVEEKQTVIRDLLCTAIRPFIPAYDAKPVGEEGQFQIFKLDNGYQVYKHRMVVDDVVTGFIHIVVKCKGEQDAGKSVEGQEE
jgi:PAS domain-containing protein